MGLDNGVRVVFHLNKIEDSLRLPTNIFHLAESIYVETSENEPSYTIKCDMIYWRRWWGVRNEVLRHLGLGDNPYRIDLTTENIKDMIKVLKYFRNQEHWDSEGMSDWFYKENHIEEQIDVDIYVLESLIKVMDAYFDMIENGLMDIYFYDSY